MSDFADRLTALDPAAGQPYGHPDLDGLITRITSQRVTAPNHVWRRFQLKMAGALAASALLTVGAIAALQGAGTVLPLLALQSTSTAGAPSANPKPFLGTMAVYEQYHFTAAPRLTPTTPTGLSYKLQIPSDQSAEALRVAAIFGVVGPTLTISGNSTHTTITDSSGRSLDYESSGLPQWHYSLNSPSVAPSTASDTSSANLPSHATLEGDVSDYLAKLGYGYTASAPNFSTSAITTTNADASTQGSMNTESVTYTVDVEGIATDQPVEFSVDANNNVVYASGPAFSVDSTSNYPLQSAANGVAALNAEQLSRFPSNSSASSTTPSGSPTNSGTGATTSTSRSSPPIVDVTLTSVSLSLATYQLTDGTLWLLPVYDYVGGSANAYGTSSTSDWYELAVDSSYVQVSSSSSAGSTHGPINY
jgi:hypothetical protein